MPETYSISVIVKPYVARYLVNNCGNPVDLSRLPKINVLLKSILRKPLFRHESLKMPEKSSYVRIQISQDTFYRYGWDLTRTDMMFFNSEIEREIKFIMRNYIAMRAGLGYPIARCIRDFQDWFNMPEEDWTFEAIKKDVDRNTIARKSEDVECFLNMLDKKMNKLFVENLSSLGTISKQFKNELSKV